MKILMVSDAWFPQVNGVVRTLDTVRGELEQMGHTVIMITPNQFDSFPCPTYPEIRLVLGAGRDVGRRIEAIDPDAIHIATEGPLGWAARNWCVKRRKPFTTAYHTRFPEYVKSRFGIPLSWTYRLLRRFHAPSCGVMVGTNSIRRELAERGFGNLRHWTRGVDTLVFHPRPKGYLDLPRPIQMYVGRIAVEKNLEAFLNTHVEGTKVLVGDGPLLKSLSRRYPQARFVGVKKGEELARYYADADVFVFPSRTDTFGLVMIEALASGVPVAAYPVAGPLDVIGNSGTGCLNEDLSIAICVALGISPESCRQHAMHFSWRVCAKMFAYNLVTMKADIPVWSVTDQFRLAQPRLTGSDLTIDYPPPEAGPRILAG